MDASIVGNCTPTSSAQEYTIGIHAAVVVCNCVIEGPVYVNAVTCITNAGVVGYIGGIWQIGIDANVVAVEGVVKYSVIVRIIRGQSI
jgi:hypothetical protein